MNNANKNNTIELLNYFDVWGNEIDGWTVNNQTRHLFEVDLHLSEMSDRYILDWLIEIGFLKCTVQLSDLEIRCEDSRFVEIFEARNSYPLCAISEC